MFTLKLNDWSFVAELPKLVERIRALGLPDVRLRHLPSNRREVCAVALTAAGALSARSYMIALGRCGRRSRSAYARSNSSAA